MYTLEITIAIGVGAALVGLIIGWLIARVAYRGKRASTLAEELEASRKEHEAYKQEVYEQFGETARKFKNLNDSYADLHKQLATSASLLCADMDPSTLLPAPNSGDALEAQSEIVEAEKNGAEAGEPTQDTAEPTVDPEQTSTTTDQPSTADTTEADAVTDTPAASQPDAGAEAGAETGAAEPEKDKAQ